MRVVLSLLVLALGCSVEDLPLDPEGATTDPAALDTGTHLEPDQTWEGLTARDISWHFLSFSSLRNSISLVGSFQITFVNTHSERTWQSQVAIRFRGGDGTLHIPATPLSNLFVFADSTVAVRENFILEVKDPTAANAIEQMTIVLF